MRRPRSPFGEELFRVPLGRSRRAHRRREHGQDHAGPIARRGARRPLGARVRSAVPRPEGRSPVLRGRGAHRARADGGGRRGPADRRLADPRHGPRQHERLRPPLLRLLPAVDRTSGPRATGPPLSAPPPGRAVGRGRGPARPAGGRLELHELFRAALGRSGPTSSTCAAPGPPGRRPPGTRFTLSNRRTRSRRGRGPADTLRSCGPPPRHALAARLEPRGLRSQGKPAETDLHVLGAQVEDERAHVTALAEGQGLNEVGGLRASRERRRRPSSRPRPRARERADATCSPSTRPRGPTGSKRVRPAKPASVAAARRPAVHTAPKGGGVARIGRFGGGGGRAAEPGPQRDRRQGERTRADEGPRTVRERTQAREVLDEGRVVEGVDLRVQGEGHLVELGRRGPAPVQLGEVQVGASAEASLGIDGQEPATRLGHETVGGGGRGFAKEQPDPHPRLQPPRHAREGPQGRPRRRRKGRERPRAGCPGRGIPGRPGRAPPPLRAGQVEVDPQVVERESPQVRSLRFRGHAALGRGSEPEAWQREGPVQLHPHPNRLGPASPGRDEAGPPP